MRLYGVLLALTFVGTILALVVPIVCCQYCYTTRKGCFSDKRCGFCYKGLRLCCQVVATGRNSTLCKLRKYKRERSAFLPRVCEAPMFGRLRQIPYPTRTVDATSLPIEGGEFIIHPKGWTVYEVDAADFPDDEGDGEDGMKEVGMVRDHFTVDWVDHVGEVRDRSIFQILIAKDARRAPTCSMDVMTTFKRWRRPQQALAISSLLELVIVFCLFIIAIVIRASHYDECDEDTCEHMEVGMTVLPARLIPVVAASGIGVSALLTSLSSLYTVVGFLWLRTSRYSKCMFGQILFNLVIFVLLALLNFVVKVVGDVGTSYCTALESTCAPCSLPDEECFAAEVAADIIPHDCYYDPDVFKSMCTELFFTRLVAANVFLAFLFFNKIATTISSMWVYSSLTAFGMDGFKFQTSHTFAGQEEPEAKEGDIGEWGEQSRRLLKSKGFLDVDEDEDLGGVAGNGRQVTWSNLSGTKGTFVALEEEPEGGGLKGTHVDDGGDGDHQEEEDDDDDGDDDDDDDDDNSGLGGHGFKRESTWDGTDVSSDA